MFKHIDWAREMDRNLTENLLMEKVASEQSAIKTVSEQEKPTEIELEMEETVKTASAECAVCKGFYVKDKDGKACTCVCKTASDCAKGCECHEAPAKPSVKKEDFPAPYSKASEVVQTLLKVSEDLDTEGFEKLAAITIVLASKVVEAKAKKSKKSKETKDEKKSKESKKSDKKMTTKERMEKMRAAKKSKKDTKKSDKK